MVEAGNFTKAAHSLRMPKATVSKLVQTLEAHLGVQLLQRTTRRVAVTPDGASYYEKGARLVKELDDIDASFSATRMRPRGHPRIDLGSSVASRLLVWCSWIRGVVPMSRPPRRLQGGATVTRPSPCGHRPCVRSMSVI